MIVKENIDVGDATPGLKISDNISKDSSMNADDHSDDSYLSNETSKSRRAFRINNILQQEGQSVVNLDDGFLRRLGSVAKN